MDPGLLLVRLVVGLGIAAHGAQKLFGWFGGPGFAGITGFVTKLGFRPAPVFALLLGLGEFGGGLLIALGLLGPFGPALVILVMLTAIFLVHRGKGFFVEGGGSELPLVYAAASLALAVTGFGAISLDAALGLEHVWTPRLVAIVLAAAVLAALANVVIRRPPKPAPGTV
ncbi:MAG TPA: DoxX family protein [Gemmatimonadota bacterium]|jgi:putative oxidoreductase